MDDKLVIAGKEFGSRLMVGTGRHRTNQEMVESVEASGAEIITVAIRRLDLDNLEEKNILDYFDWSEYTILPNTAGCKTAEEAVFTARLAREVTGTDWIKLEVIPYPEYLLPDPSRDLRRRKAAYRGRVCRSAVHSRRPRSRKAARGPRLRHGDAAGFGDRLRPGRPDAGGNPADYPSVQRSGRGGRGPGGSVRRLYRAGSGRGRRAGEHRNRAGGRPRWHG